MKWNIWKKIFLTCKAFSYKILHDLHVGTFYNNYDKRLINTNISRMSWNRRISIIKLKFNKILIKTPSPNISPSFIINFVQHSTRKVGRVLNLVASSHLLPLSSSAGWLRGISASRSICASSSVVEEFLTLIYEVYWSNGSRLSSGCIVSDYGLDYRAIGVRSPAGAKDSSSSLCVQAHPASCTMGTGGTFPGGKSAAGAWRWPLTPF
jgi:hypothetical protein